MKIDDIMLQIVIPIMILGTMTVTSYSIGRESYKKDVYKVIDKYQTSLMQNEKCPEGYNAMIQRLADVGIGYAAMTDEILRIK